MGYKKMNIFKKPTINLSQEEKEYLKNAEKEAFIEEAVELAKVRGKIKAGKQYEV